LESYHKHMPAPRIDNSTTRQLCSGEFGNPLPSLVMLKILDFFINDSPAKRSGQNR
jgi:hypothetical protein